jgi:hypothetical protein
MGEKQKEINSEEEKALLTPADCQLSHHQTNNNN